MVLFNDMHALQLITAYLEADREMSPSSSLCSASELLMNQRRRLLANIGFYFLFFSSASSIEMMGMEISWTYAGRWLGRLALRNQEPLNL